MVWRASLHPDLSGSRMTPTRTRTSTGLYVRLDAARARFDRLLSDVAGGIRSPQHYDAIEAEVDAICRAARVALRGRP